MNVTVILNRGPSSRGELCVRLSYLEICQSITSCTAPFERAIYYWTVPQRKLIDPLEVFKIVFKTDVWILIILTFVLTSVIWWFIGWCTQKVNFTSALLKVYSLTIFSAMDKVPSILSLRFIFITYVMYAIHIQSIFTSNLIKLLTNVHYEPAIETLEQLAQSDLPILMYAGSIGIFHNKERNDSLYMKIANKTHGISWDGYMKSLFDETILEYNSVFVQAELLQEMIIKHNIKMRVISDDTLLGANKYMFGTNIGFHLIKPVEKIVSTLLEAGLIDFKASEFNRFMEKFEYKYKGESKNYGNSSNPKVLSLTHVYPIFVIWVLSYLSIVTCYLTITEKKFYDKTCMKDVLKSVGTETTVVYVYKKVFEDILPENLEQPLLTIDISFVRFFTSNCTFEQHGSLTDHGIYRITDLKRTGYVNQTGTSALINENRMIVRNKTNEEGALHEI
ncbi:hypothetical protein FQA39_LY04189 [Lamprigera yunnana]|nr:hypothetical protein FQA39_LY04189 [Lamprigera yunnana]